jgi:hypothetical protein
MTDFDILCEFKYLPQLQHICFTKYHCIKSYYIFSSSWKYKATPYQLIKIKAFKPQVLSTWLKYSPMFATLTTKNLVWLFALLLPNAHKNSNNKSKHTSAPNNSSCSQNQTTLLSNPLWISQLVNPMVKLTVTQYLNMSNLMSHI